MIPNSVTSIGYNAFRGCYSLTSVEIPNSVTSIGESAFYGCSSLASLEIPNSVTSIGSSVFQFCSRLTSVEIPNSVTSIGHYAFSGCTRLTSVEIPNSVTAIGESAFYGCSSLTSVEIPKSVTWIGSDAFSGCSNVRKIILGCSSYLAKQIPREQIEEIVLKENIDRFTAYPFDECKYLYKLTVLSKEPPVITRSQFSDEQLEGVVVAVPEESIEKYKKGRVWEYFRYFEGDEDNTIVGAPHMKPVIRIEDGKLNIYSPTEGSSCKYSITSDDIVYAKTGNNVVLPLSGQYKIRAYAVENGKRKSETAEAVLVWVNPEFFDVNNIIGMDAKKAIVISSQGNMLKLSGTERGEQIQLFSLDGKKIVSAEAETGETELQCDTNGQIVIVKYGDKAVKVKL